MYSLSFYKTFSFCENLYLNFKWCFLQSFYCLIWHYRHCRYEINTAHTVFILFVQVFKTPAACWCVCVCVCLRLESSRDDLCVRADVLEREMTDLQLRNEELTSLAQEAQSLKDEMDILRSETRDASLSAVWRSFCVPHRCFLLQALVWPRQSPGGHGGDV